MNSSDVNVNIAITVEHLECRSYRVLKCFEITRSSDLTTRTVVTVEARTAIYSGLDLCYISFTQPDYIFRVPPLLRSTIEVATRLLGSGVLLSNFYRGTAKVLCSNRVHITRLQHGNPVKWATKMLPSQ